MTTHDWLFVGCEVEHDWKALGGASCGCEEEACSVPVFTCSRCGECDYGVNAEADRIRADCIHRRDNVALI